MDMGRYSTDLASLEKMMVCSVLKAVAVEALLTVQSSLAFLLTMAFQTESLFNNAIALPKLTENNERFPLEELNKRQQQPDLENKDDDDDSDDEDGDEDGDDASDEDFSGEEGEEGGEDEGAEEEKGKTPEANGNGVSDDDEDEDDEDGEDDEDDEDGDEEDDDEEDEEDEDEDDEDQPPAKKRK